MPAPAHNRALLRKGATFAGRKKAAKGFDYPATTVGVSVWKGSDGKPVTVYFDKSTGQAGLDAAHAVLNRIDVLMAACDAWFGVRGRGGNVIVCPDFGGAYHYGCSFDEGGDWYCSVGAPDTVVGLAVAEITESYMGLQNKGWNCGGSGGEALSRVLAEVCTGGATGALADYTSGPSWDGTNWIDSDSGTDQDYPSTGCGVLYLWWMMGKYDLTKIVQAGEPDGVLAGNYAALTGVDAANAWGVFKSAVQSIGGPGSFDNDNPFNTPTPPLPGGPVPPPPPPPPPGQPGTFTGTGQLHLGESSFPLNVQGTFAGSPSPPPAASPWNVLGDLAAIVSDWKRGNPEALATDVEQLLTDLGIVLSVADRVAFTRALTARLAKVIAGEGGKRG